MGWIVVSLTLILGGLAPFEEQRKEPLTLEDCWRIAEENHGSLIAARRNLRSAEASLTVARAPLIPQLGFGGTFFRGGVIGQQTGFTQRRFGVTETRQYSLNADWTLWDGGRTQERVRQAKAQVRSLQSTLEDTRQSVLFNVTRAYFDLLRAQRLAALAEEQLESAQGHLKLVNARIEVGEAAAIDRYPVEVEVANARLNLLTARNQVRIATNALANAMGLKSGTSLVLADVPEPQIEPVDLEAALQRAFLRRPDLRRLESQMEAARAALNLARIEQRPLLNLASSLEEGLGESATRRRWQINASLTFPIFDAGAARAGVEQAKASLEAVQASYEQLRKDIEAEVEEAYLLLTNAQERIVASRALVEQARRNLEAANEKYRLGLAIVLEIVDAQVAFFNAQVNLIQAIYDHHIARAQLERAQGILASAQGKE